MLSNLKTTVLGNYVKIISIDLKTTSSEEAKREYCKNENKLKNNLIRAKNRITDIALANDFKYYFTVTFSTKYDRYSLDQIYTKFKNKLKVMREACGHRIDYLVVPEQHKDGAWHLHGFFTSHIDDFLYVNKHHHIDISYLNELGWVNVQLIQDQVRISHYITKYIQKNLGKCIDLYKHVYFASTGLNKGVEDLNVLYDNERFNSSYFDFKTDFCYKKIITLEEYQKIKWFLTKL